MKTAKNTQISEENLVAEKIRAILRKTGLKEIEFTSQQTGGLIAQIFKEIPDATENKELGLFLIEKFGGWFYMDLHPKLREDEDIVGLVLQTDPKILSNMSFKREISERNMRAILAGFALQKTPFIEVECFLQEKCKEKGEFLKWLKIWKVLRNTLTCSRIENLLIEIRESSYETYKLFFEKRLLSRHGTGVSLHVDAIKYVGANLSEIEEVSSNKNTEQQKSILLLLSQYMCIDIQNLDEKVKLLLSELSKNIFYESEKKTTDTQKEITEGIGESEENIFSEEGSIKESHNITSSNNYSFSSGYCYIYTSQRRIEISQSELELFSDTALQNYIYAIDLFDEIGLGFVFRYKEQFFRTICGIDYLQNPGLTEGKILTICNILGKRIGIPTKHCAQNLEGEDEEPQIETGCFHTLSEARYRFGEIKSSGKINGKTIEDPAKRGNSTIVEIFFKKIGYLDLEGRGFRIAKFLKNIK